MVSHLTWATWFVSLRAASYQGYRLFTGFSVTVAMGLTVSFEY